MSAILVTPRALSRGHPLLGALTDRGHRLVMPASGATPDEAALIAALPGCVGWIAGVEPVSEADIAAARIDPGARLIPADAGEVAEPLPGLRLTVLPAAHETLARDAAGRHHFLGYGLTVAGLTLYHSGDCIPFDGLLPALCRLGPDIALLPVNGRDAARLAGGIPGNFTLDEAIALARAAGAGVLIPHHFGMFSFNTCDVALIDRAAAMTAAPRSLRPDPGETLRIGATDGPDPDRRR